MGGWACSTDRFGSNKRGTVANVCYRMNARSGGHVIAANPHCHTNIATRTHPCYLSLVAPAAPTRPSQQVSNCWHRASIRTCACHVPEQGVEVGPPRARKPQSASPFLPLPCGRCAHVCSLARYLSCVLGSRFQCRHACKRSRVMHALPRAVPVLYSSALDLCC